jgi:hypothetical protein
LSAAALRGWAPAGRAPSPRLTAASSRPDGGPPEPPTSAVLPTPSCPRALHPQQTTLPSARMAQVWQGPAVIAVAVRPGQGTLAAVSPSDPFFLSFASEQE